MNSLNIIRRTVGMALGLVIVSCSPALLWAQQPCYGRDSLPHGSAAIPPQVIFSSYLVTPEHYPAIDQLSTTQLNSEVIRVRRLLHAQRDLPMTYQRIDSDLRLLHDDWQAAERQANEYERMNRFIVGNPLPLSQNWQRQTANSARERYYMLQQERANIQRFGSLEQYLNELEIGLSQRQ
jgi:hypothetical protein